MDIQIKNIILETKNLSKVSKNKFKNKHSLKYLIKRQMTHSECIKLGIFLEKVIRNLVLSFTNLQDINTTKNIKNTLEKDHLFIDEHKKSVYYCEIKSNLSLDTEKRKSTETKIKNIKEELSVKYKNYNIIESFVCLRYLEIPDSIQKLYTIKVISINEYFHILGCSIKFNEEDYIEFLNFCCDSLFLT